MQRRSQRTVAIEKCQKICINFEIDPLAYYCLEIQVTWWKVHFIYSWSAGNKKKIFTGLPEFSYLKLKMRYSVLFIVCL